MDGTCRVCGCTDATPCPDGCGWVEVDLCSSCAPQELLLDVPTCHGCGDAQVALWATETLCVACFGELQGEPLVAAAGS